MAFRDECDTNCLGTAPRIGPGSASVPAGCGILLLALWVIVTGWDICSNSFVDTINCNWNDTKDEVSQVK